MTLHSLIRLGVSLVLPLAILYFLSVSRERDPEGFLSAYRFGLKIALFCVLLALIPQIRSYADLVIPTARDSRSISAPQEKPTQEKPAQGKLSAANLELQFARASRLAPNADLRCKPADRGWDYTCSYLPTPLQSTTRLEFGISVDEKTWVRVSPVVPAGTTIPPPR